MAFSRSQEFRTNEQHTALICQALSHPARIRMISRLVNAQDSSLDYPSITNDIPLNPSTISQHLKYLRSRNIIEHSYDDNNYIYKLKTDNPLLMDCINAIVAMSDHLSDENLDKELDVLKGSEL